MLYNYCGDLFEKIRDEYVVDVSMIPYLKYYRETKGFKEAVLDFVFSICELNPTDKIGPIIHEFLKKFFFKNPSTDVVFTNISGMLFYLCFGKTTVPLNVKNKKS